MQDFTELLKDCETDLRAGRTQSVAKRLGRLNTSKIPREMRLPLANVCRRAGLVSVGMKILSAAVRPKRGGEMATSGELAEYAVLLHRSGANNEALATLARVDTSKVPEALLYRAFCNFQDWEFDQAIVALGGYLEAPLAPYPRFVGQVNLAAAHVWAQNWDKALELLGANIATAKESSYFRLQANCHELRAQVHLSQNRMGEARVDLEEANKLFVANSAGLDQLFVKKWTAIVSSLESGRLEKIEDFRTEALTRQNWESVRDVDFWALRVQFEEDRFEHLLFGTPFPNYRARVCEEFGREPERSHYVFGAESAPCLDLASGCLVGTGRELLSPGKKGHQALEALLRDFYRPLRLGSLFAELFPGEHFDIFSSPDRVHQILRRTRRALEENDIPVVIEEIKGSYKVRIEGNFSFLVPWDRRPVEGHHVDFARLQAEYPVGQRFSAKEARLRLGMPKSTFQLLTSWAVEHGKLEMSGPKNAARYRVRNAA